jgi:hypothetical protein
MSTGRSIYAAANALSAVAELHQVGYKISAELAVEAMLRGEAWLADHHVRDFLVDRGQYLDVWATRCDLVALAEDGAA